MKSGEERRDDIDSHRASGYTALASQFYFLTVPALILLFAPAAAPLRWAAVALLIGALTAGICFTVLASRARRRFTRAAHRLMEEEEQSRAEEGRDRL